MADDKQPKRKKGMSGTVASQGALLLGLSLFIILLAFFIVLNGLSQYSEQKVGRAIESLETAFSQSIITTPSEKSSMNESQGGDTGQGDSIKELQGVLQSILPNLNMQSNPNPNGGSVMAIRMEKNQFERMSNNLIPLFARILNEKDSTFSYGVSFTSYVRDPASEQANQSFSVLNKYHERMVGLGVSPSRLSMILTRGNPAIIMFTFESMPKDQG